jgi:ribosomal protein S8E
MRKNTKFLSAIAVAGLVAAAGSAFTASSTIDAANKVVGTTSQTISGVHVTNVQYTVGGNDTTTAVAFHVAEVLTAADTVKATISSSSPSATQTSTCTKTAVLTAGTQTSTDLACDFGSGTANVTSLSIVAS